MIFNGTTVAFSTKANVWKTRYSFTPSCYMTMDNDFLSSNRLGTMTNEILYKHDVNYTHNSFYGDASVPSTIEVVSNQNPSAVKIFKALSLETDARVWNGSVYTNKTRDSYAYQEGALNPFVQKEGNQYVDMPRSATNSSSNITFVGTVALGNFSPAFYQAQLNSLVVGDDFALRVYLKNIPDVNLPVGSGSFLLAGAPNPRLIGIPDGIPQLVGSEQGYPSTNNGEVWFQVLSYNESDNTLTIGMSNVTAINDYMSNYFQFNLNSDFNDGNGGDVPIYIMTNPVLDGDNMRGPYAGIKLTSPNSSSAFELYSINVDYEKTKLDGSLG